MAVSHRPRPARASGLRRRRGARHRPHRCRRSTDQHVRALALARGALSRQAERVVARPSLRRTPPCHGAPHAVRARNAARGRRVRTRHGHLDHRQPGSLAAWQLRDVAGGSALLALAAATGPGRPGRGRDRARARGDDPHHHGPRRRCDGAGHVAPPAPLPDGTRHRPCHHHAAVALVQSHPLRHASRRAGGHHPGGDHLAWPSRLLDDAASRRRRSRALQPEPRPPHPVTHTLADGSGDGRGRARAGRSPGRLARCRHGRVRARPRPLPGLARGRLLRRAPYHGHPSGDLPVPGGRGRAGAAAPRLVGRLRRAARTVGRHPGDRSGLLPPRAQCRTAPVDVLGSSRCRRRALPA